MKFRIYFYSYFDENHVLTWRRPIQDESVPAFVVQELKDGSGNKAVITETLQGRTYQWTREIKEIE